MLENVGQGMRKLGLEHVGDFTLARFGGVEVRGLAGQEHPFIGIASRSPITGLNVDLYTAFENGTSLTTSTMTAPEDPARRIFRKARVGGSVGDLHEARLEGLAEHLGASRSPRGPDASLMGVIHEIDDFLSRLA